MSLATFLKAIIGSSDRVLGKCSLLTSFLKISASLDKDVVNYVSFAIENGSARKFHDGSEWTFCAVEMMPPCPIQSNPFPQRPIFHATANDGVRILGTINVGGGVWLRFEESTNNLAEVEFTELISPPNSRDQTKTFFWGICPSDPEAVQKRHETVFAILAEELKPDDYFEVNEIQCISGDSGNAIGVRIATLQTLGTAMAMPLYFFGDVPNEDDPVMLCDPDHTVAEENVLLSELAERIRSLKKLAETRKD